MPDELLHPRFAESTLESTLADSPVVLIHGPRQSGKTTLARVIGRKRGYAYFSFDDDVTLETATSDPAGFIADLPEKCILDEVQRVPALFTSMKAAVDRDRRPGRFKTRNYGRLGRELTTRIVAGGYPAALARSTPKRRTVWYRDYIETLVQCDVRKLARRSRRRISAVSANCARRRASALRPASCSTTEKRVCRSGTGCTRSRSEPCGSWFEMSEWCPRQDSNLRPSAP